MSEKLPRRGSNTIFRHQPICPLYTYSGVFLARNAEHSNVQHDKGYCQPKTQNCFNFFEVFSQLYPSAI